MAKNKRGAEQKKRRSLLASLFEPAGESETEGLFDEPEMEEELVHLFDDDEVDYSDEQDAAALSDLTWDDGERVVDELPQPEAENGEAHGRRRREAAEPDAEDKPRPRRRKSRQAAEHASPHRMAPVPVSHLEDAEQPQQPEPEATPAATPEPHAGNGALDAAAFLARDAAPARDAVPAPGQPPAQAAEGAAREQTPEERPVPAADGQSPEEAYPGAEQRAGGTPPAHAPGESGAASRASRTRMFRTGTGTTARINVNETETLRNIDAAMRRQREEQARLKHEAYVRRQKRQRRRQRAVKRMAINVAFVAFIVIAVLAALYFTFLLDDIVVVGNETYSSDYIVELSGLQYGRHMLLCDLEAARAGIEQDPYLQVDAVDYIFPARVRIRVTERKEVAGIIGLDYNIIIDHNGYVLSMSGGTDLSDLLQVTGVSMTGFQVGQRLGQTDDFGTATLITMIQKLEQYSLLDDIVSLDLTTPLAIVMRAQNGLKIQVGQPTDLDEKMLSLQKNLPQFMSANISTGTLYLSARGGTVYSPTDAGQVLVDDAGGTDGTGDTDGTGGTDGADGTDGAGGTDGTGGLDNPAQATPGVPTPPPTATPLQPGGGDGFQG